MNYSPRRLMDNPMVHEQVYKIDNMLDAAGINAVYTLVCRSALAIINNRCYLHSIPHSERFLFSETIPVRYAFKRTQVQDIIFVTAPLEKGKRSTT